MIDGKRVGCIAPPGNIQTGFLLRVRLFRHESQPTPAVSCTCEALLRTKAPSTYTCEHENILVSHNLHTLIRTCLSFSGFPKQGRGQYKALKRNLGVFGASDFKSSLQREPYRGFLLLQKLTGEKKNVFRETATKHQFVQLKSFFLSDVTYMTF